MKAMSSATQVKAAQMKAMTSAAQMKVMSKMKSMQSMSKLTGSKGISLCVCTTSLILHLFELTMKRNGWKRLVYEVTRNLAKNVC